MTWEGNNFATPEGDDIGDLLWDYMEEQTKMRKTNERLLEIILLGKRSYQTVLEGK